jgi:hypothetical protein
MPTSIAHVQTELPRRYLGQLCKHFEHKLPVTLEEARGHIAFSFGTCTLTTTDGTLVLQAEAADPESLARTEDVVARHLLRFAFRAPPEIVWLPA